MSTRPNRPFSPVFITPPLVVFPFPIPSLQQALLSLPPFGVYSQVVERPTLPDPTRASTWPSILPVEQALPIMSTLLPPLIALPHPSIKKPCVVEDTDLEEGLMSGDLPLVLPYASQPMHSTFRLPIHHHTTTLRYCLRLQHYH